MLVAHTTLLEISCHGSFFCCLLTFYKINFFNFSFSKNAFTNTIIVSNSLDPDQAQHSVGPGLGPNCLRRLSADKTSRQRD